MAVHFHPLMVKEVKKETEQCVSVSFEMPESLRETYAFTQGQHITLKTVIDGHEVRRNYSLCSSPLDNEWRIAIKNVPEGLFSTWANKQLKSGMMLEVMPPTGRFYTALDANAHKNYLAIAAGSGITPIMSIIHTTLRAEPNSTFTLIYGNRNRSSIIFKEQLEALKDKFLHRFRLVHILSRERTGSDINHGRIDAAKCQTLAQSLLHLPGVDACFLCGPEPMIMDAKATLEAAGLPKERIHFELFSSAASHRPKAITDVAAIANQPTAEVTLTIDGLESSFKLAYLGNSILDAALHHGSQLPYACKGGVCCTCKAKLVEGKVEMDVVYGLEPDEIEAGYVLTCQSHPRTPVVRLNYDI